MFGASEFDNREDRIVSVSNVCYFDIRKATLPTITVRSIRKATLPTITVRRPMIGLQGRSGPTEHYKNHFLG